MQEKLEKYITWSLHLHVGYRSRFSIVLTQCKIDESEIFIFTDNRFHWKNKQCAVTKYAIVKSMSNLWLLHFDRKNLMTSYVDYEV